MTLRSLFKEERGQDLAEYCLLTALVLLVAAGIFFQVSGGMQNLWTGANRSLANGNSAQTSGGGSGSATASTPAR